MERNSVGLRTMVDRVLGDEGANYPERGIFVLEGISIEFPGIIPGGLGYYFCLTAQGRVGQTLGIFAAALNAVSMGISGLEAPPQ